MDVPFVQVMRAQEGSGWIEMGGAVGGMTLTSGAASASSMARPPGFAPGAGYMGRDSARRAHNCNSRWISFSTEKIDSSEEKKPTTLDESLSETDGSQAPLSQCVRQLHACRLLAGSD